MPNSSFLCFFSGKSYHLPFFPSFPIQSESSSELRILPPTVLDEFPRKSAGASIKKKCWETLQNWMMICFPPQKRHKKWWVSHKPSTKTGFLLSYHWGGPVCPSYCGMRSQLEVSHRHTFEKLPGNDLDADLFWGCWSWNQMGEIFV